MADLFRVSENQLQRVGKKDGATSAAIILPVWASYRNKIFRQPFYLTGVIGLPPLSALLMAPVWSIQYESLPVRP
jgi:hypothetical protein